MIIYFKSQLIKAFGFISILHGHKEVQVEVSWTFFISPIFDNAQLLPQVVVLIPVSNSDAKDSICNYAGLQAVFAV